MDYRNLAFRKNQGLRIDHILVSEALRPRVTACEIDKLPRKNERPSDHAPVIATLAERPHPGAPPGAPGSVVQTEFLDLAGDGVAADAELDCAASMRRPRVRSSAVWISCALELARQLRPRPRGSPDFQQRARLALEIARASSPSQATTGAATGAAGVRRRG